MSTHTAAEAITTARLYDILAEMQNYRNRKNQQPRHGAHNSVNQIQSTHGMTFPSNNRNNHPNAFNGNFARNPYHRH
ncbi:hypothetical protein I4U23_027262 [Adineta vaga]|nr:hypothetical protein I4U23_027262 [Adineta vaga]